MNSIKDRLLHLLHFFDLQKALELSTEMHDAECNGHIFTRAEDRLWEKLTDKIESNR